MTQPWGAQKAEPDAFLDPGVRAGISVFAQLSSAAVDRAIEALSADLETGRWQERHRELLTMEELHLGLLPHHRRANTADRRTYMKVIGAGLPRTGTLSQKVALEMLGFGPCYHMVNVLTDLPLANQWERALDGEADWDEIFGEHESTVDWPGAFFYRELADAYPDAKIVLSTRDPEAWEKSMRETIWDTIYGQSPQAHISKARELVDPDWQHYIRVMSRMWAAQGIFTGRELAPGQLGEAISRYQEQVQRNIPEDRLLVWSVVDGWEPLCRFLEVDVPDAQFPRLNDSKMYKDRIVDASLVVLQQWRTRDGAEFPARQPA